MIYSLKGTLTYIEPTFAVVECGGVGFKCFASTTTITSLTSIGTEVKLLTYMSIREDAMDLYGFATQNELDAFKLLISVSGVGPKAAISILSALAPDRLAVAVSCGDVKSIQAAQGVGKKTAERIVLELKDKLAKGLDLQSVGTDIAAASTVSASGNASEAVSALTMLGYSQSEAAVAVGKLSQDLSVEEMIKQALKQLSMI